MKKSAFLLFLQIILGCALAVSVKAQMKQRPDVIEAYRVLRQYRQLLAENFDFERAFEVTFTRDKARQRAIAEGEGEFGSEEDLREVSDELLIKAYKKRMQIFYLILALTGAGKIDSVIPMPPEIDRISKRESPKNAREFSAFVSQLEKDAAFLHSFIERSSKENPMFAESIRRFKSEIFPEKFEPPPDYIVKPARGYSRNTVLKSTENYYEINGYSLIKEQGKIKIIGIRFFTRLF
jgi:hypothetical protein